VSSRTTKQSQLRLKGNDWLIIPLGIVLIICIVLMVPNAVRFDTIFTTPTLVITLIGVFSIFYIYEVLAHKNIRLLAKIIAYIFSITFLGILLLSLGQSCGGFFGTQGNCNDAIYLLFWLFLLNPISIPIVLLLSVGGLVALLIPKTKKYTPAP